MGKLSPLASVAATRETLDRFGLSTKKQLGQNFLINDDILVKIVALARLEPTDAVLEVGPGIGTLTVALLKSARCVVSVERDPNLPVVLAETCKPWENAFQLISKDALDLREEDVAQALASLGAETFPAKLVANLPYAVAATVVLDFFQRFPWLQSATVMVQKEVADRMAAAPGNKNYGAYTVKLGMHARANGRFAVGPGNFFPPPHVESSVIRLDRHTPQQAHDAAARLSVPTNEIVRATCTMADAAFATRRKTIANSCKTYFNGKGATGKQAAAQLPCIFDQAGIDPKRRGESLDQAEFIHLGEAYLAIMQIA